MPVYTALGTPIAGDEATARRPPNKADEWVSRLSCDEADLAAMMERDGTAEAYAAAYERQGGARPQHPVRSMWGWFTRATEARLPDWAARFYRRHYNAGVLAAQTFNGMVAIFADGELREFVPVKLLRGQRVSAIGRGEAQMLKPASREDLEVWVRTKHGYVPNNGAFAQMMRRRSVGAFADVRQ